jgi:hypothetical protein
MQSLPGMADFSQFDAFERDNFSLRASDMDREAGMDVLSRRGWLGGTPAGKAQRGPAGAA